MGNDSTGEGVAGWPGGRVGPSEPGRLGGLGRGKPLLGVVAAYGNRLIVFAVLLFLNGGAEEARRGL